jgi:hypothetical protein
VAVAGNSTTMEVLRDKLSRLSISNMRVREEQAKNFILLEIEFNQEQQLFRHWSRAQHSVPHNPGSLSEAFADKSDMTFAADHEGFIPLSSVQMQFSRPVLPFMDQMEPIALDPFSLPAVTFCGNEAPYLDATGWNHISTTITALSTEKDSFLSSDEKQKGVTYPSGLDDSMADISFP